MTDQVIDGEIVGETEESYQLPAQYQAPAMVVRPVAGIEDILEAVRQYAIVKRRILEPSDVQHAGKDRSFIKRSGWCKLALAFGVTTRIIEGYPIMHRDEDGNPLYAECKVVARAPNGREAEGWGACSIQEPRFTQTEDKPRGGARKGECTHDEKCPLHWAHKGDPVESGRQKLEHDLPSTAQTRARNRACADLFGMGEVSAEEVDARVPDDPQRRALLREVNQLIMRAANARSVEGEDIANEVRTNTHITGAIRDASVEDLEDARDYLTELIGRAQD